MLTSAFFASACATGADAFSLSPLKVRVTLLLAPTCSTVTLSVSASALMPFSLAVLRDDGRVGGARGERADELVDGLGAG